MDLIEKVRPAVTRHVRRTPLLRSDWLSRETGAEIFLKCENLQVTGSFKARGAFAYCSVHRPPSVLASSAGNHGLGLALASKTFGIPCTIVVPSSVPRVKEEAIRSLGARVVRSPHAGYDDTQSWTLEHAAGLGGDFVSPFDDPAVMAGNGGTTALEILDEVSDLDAIVVPCGGGGCAVGAGMAVRERSPSTRVIGVNTDASPGMWLSRRDGRPHLRVESRSTIAEGIEGGVSAESFRLAQETVHEIVTVPEESIRRSVAEIALRQKLVVEGSAAAGVAALREGRVRGGRVCVMLSGSNIDPERFASLLRENLAEPRSAS